MQDITNESGKLSINLKALADNYRTFQSITPNKFISEATL